LAFRPNSGRSPAQPRWTVDPRRPPGPPAAAAARGAFGCAAGRLCRSRSGRQGAARHPAARVEPCLRARSARRADAPAAGMRIALRGPRLHALLRGDGTRLLCGTNGLVTFARRVRARGEFVRDRAVHVTPCARRTTRARKRSTSGGRC